MNPYRTTGESPDPFPEPPREDDFLRVERTLVLSGAHMIGKGIDVSLHEWVGEGLARDIVASLTIKVDSRHAAWLAENVGKKRRYRVTVEPID